MVSGQWKRCERHSLGVAPCAVSLTRPERHALLFLTAVIALGSGLRVLRAARPRIAPADSAALARQLTSVDSAREAGRRARTPKGEKRSARSVTRDTARAARFGPAARLDLDRASEVEIEALPWVGPVLARRIVEDRRHRGPFGSMDALQTVRGIGPALARRLDSMVTFSGPLRPPSATPIDASPRRTRRRSRTDSIVLPQTRRLRATRAEPQALSPEWLLPSPPASALEISSFVRG